MESSTGSCTTPIVLRCGGIRCVRIGVSRMQSDILHWQGGVGPWQDALDVSRQTINAIETGKFACALRRRQPSFHSAKRAHLPTRQVSLSRSKIGCDKENVDPRGLAETIPPMWYQQIPNLGDLNLGNS